MSRRFQRYKNDSILQDGKAYFRRSLGPAPRTRGGGGGIPYDGLYGEAPPERGIFFGLQVYERVGISLVEVYKRVEKSFIWLCERA